MNLLNCQSKLMLPIIDLNDDQTAIVKKIDQAAQTHGLFYIINHGLTTLNLADQVSEEFFNGLNQAERDVYMGHGYSPFGAESLDRANQSMGDRKHGFSFKSEASSDSRESLINPPATWASNTTLPVAKYMNTVMYDFTALGLKLAEYFALGMQIKQNAFAEYLKKPLRYLRILEYPAIQSLPTQGIFGAGAHTDYGLITILYIQRGKSGLQILTQDNEWLEVPAMENCLVVNVGEMMRRFSNGKYKPVVHRVVKDASNESRRSMVLFLNGDRKMQVAPLIAAARPGEEASITTLEEFLAEKNKLAFPNGTPNQDQSNPY